MITRPKHNIHTPTVADPVGITLSRWEQVRDAREFWTREAFRDLEYKAGNVWNSLELADFASRGIEPPNYNLSLHMMLTVTGLEAQNRAEVKYLPRGPQDTQGAQALTQLARKVCEDAKMGRKVSRAFENSASVGIGYLMMKKNRNPFKNKLDIVAPGAFDVWMDDCCQEPDYSDAMDQFVARYVRPQQLGNLYPHLKTEIAMLRGYQADRMDLSHSADYTLKYGDFPDVGTDEWNGGWYGGYGSGYHRRERIIQVVTRWYKVQTWSRFVTYHDGRVFEVPLGDDRQSHEMRRGLAQAIIDGYANPAEDEFVDRIRKADFAEGLLLSDTDTDLPHRDLPIIPLVCYRDEYNRPMGMIRQIRTPQKDFNARMSNLLTRATTKQTFVETDAIDDLDAFADALGDPAAVIPVRPGALTKKKIVHRDELGATPIEGNMLQVDQKFATDMSGVTAEMQGQKTNADSGRAILAKQGAGQTAMYTLFDARDAAVEKLGEHLAAGIQAEFTVEMAVRVNESTKGLDWIFINKRDPSTGAVLNDITQLNYDSAITSIPFSANVNMAKMEALAEFIGPMPMEVKLMFAAKMAILADIPDAEEVAAELDAFKQMVLGGMVAPPPGAAPPGAAPAPTPPAQAAPAAPMPQ